MKHFASTTTLLLFLFITAAGYSQQAALKPQLFSAYPDVVDCTPSELARIFTIAQGQQADIALSAGFVFSGTVSSNVQKFSNLQSVVIKSPAFSNAIFHVSRRTTDGNGVVYVGRIIHDAFADGYELKQAPGGGYRLQKIQAAKVMPDCTHQ